MQEVQQCLDFKRALHQSMIAVSFGRESAVKGLLRVGKPLVALLERLKTKVQYSFSLCSGKNKKKRLSDSLAPNYHLRQLI